MLRLFLFLSLLPAPCSSETVVAARVIRAHSLVTEDVISVVAADIAGAYQHPNDVLGLEARVSIYPGRPIRQGDVGPAALVERNQIVTLVYSQNGLSILTEGRCLSRAAAGETARVMNLASRKSVTGTVRPDGSVLVSN